MPQPAARLGLCQMWCWACLARNTRESSWTLQKHSRNHVPTSPKHSLYSFRSSKRRCAKKQDCWATACFGSQPGSCQVMEAVREAQTTPRKGAESICFWYLSEPTNKRVSDGFYSRRRAPLKSTAPLAMRNGSPEGRSRSNQLARRKCRCDVGLVSNISELHNKIWRSKIHHGILW